jgi:hypothetical protein
VGSDPASIGDAAPVAGDDAPDSAGDAGAAVDAPGPAPAMEASTAGASLSA